MPLGSDLLAGALLTLVFLALIGLAELWRHLGSPDPEWTRKLVHVGGGGVCIALPFLIQSHWVVLAMALGMALLFTIARFTGMLPSLYGVQRHSGGTEYYPVVIYLLFVLTRDRTWCYVICVLVLAVSDGLAALVGGKYGRLRYEVEEEWKSLEGSLAFLLITLLVVFVPLLVWPDPGNAIPDPLSCALAALLVASLVTAFEAVSLRGSDNLWVPLGTYVVLTKTLRQDFGEIALQIVGLVAIVCVISLSAWWTTAFNVGGTLVITLAAYASWSLGSFDWAFPVFLGFAVYLIARSFVQEQWTIKVRPAVRELLLPFLVLVAANVARQRADEADFMYRFLYGPYLAGCVTVAVQTIANQLPWPGAGWKQGAPALAVSAGCWTIIAVATWLAMPQVPAAALFATAAVCIPLGCLSTLAIGRRVPSQAERRWIVLRLAFLASAMALVAALQAAGLSPLWNPR